jgi:tetratricopeptide (TPR) repeat protein
VDGVDPQAGESPAGREATARPFVGRTRELADLSIAIDAAGSGAGSLVLVTGEPGIGKTRLIAELAHAAADGGLAVASGRCWEEGGAPPYWPWIQVLRALGGDLDQLAAAAEPRVPVPGGTGGITPEGERIRLFDAVGRFLADAAADRPLLVTLDDMHAADEPSLLLLRFLAEALTGAGVVLVASYRDGEPRVREMGGAFSELARAGQRLALQGLGSDDIGTYLATVTGASPTPELVARLHEITAGNPFFMGEVMRLLRGSLGALDPAIGDPFLRIPEEVRVLIRRRVAGLTAEAVATLRIAAVIGREFDLQVLQQMSRLSPARLLEVLGEAAAVGVIGELPPVPSRCAFAHELVRETLYEDLPPARRMELHREVGRLLERVHAADLDPHLSEIARHLYLAAPLGEPGEALEYLVRAGDRAAALFAYEEAALHYRPAIELLAMVDGGSGQRRCQLLLRLGDAQWRSGDGVEARTTFEEAIDAARRLGNGELLARAALGYVTALGGFLLYARFEVGGTGVGLLEEALSALPAGDSALRAHLLAHLALEMWSGHEPVERRVAVSDEAIAMARMLGDSEALVTALHARHWALTTPGMAFERLAHTEEMLRVAKETINPEIEFLAHNARFHCFLELCDRRGMEAETQAMTDLAERLRQPFYRWHTISLSTLRAALDGRFAEAERLAREALALGGLRQSEYATYVFRYAQMLEIRWAQGRLGDLWADIDDHADRFPWIPRWRDALSAAELGDEQRCRSELERHASRGFTDLPRDGLWILHLCVLADASVTVGDRARALQLYELLRPHADDNAVSYTQQPFGPVALRLGRLAALLDRPQESDRHFAAALARCELLGAPAIRARTLIEHARALANRGEPADHSRQKSMLAEAAQLVDELGLTGLADRIAPVSEPPPAGDVFRRDGELWTIAYHGDEFRLRDVKGLGYIATLLAAPGRELHVLDLVGAGRRRKGEAAALDVPSGTLAARQPVLDEQARREIRGRLDELDAEVDRARAWGDAERAAQLAEHRDLLIGELARATGLRGRDRGFASPAERARISVTKAIKTAIRLIDRQCPALAEHLQASVQTGRFCCYAPPGAAPPVWSL